ncbi:MAG TPA: hypothetical protein VFE47_22985 [Tepidisphaeraceae bacterium]|jgi:hypothetical protein|nr:hypothetical protein [Tepidisphaeraceae bacterium]
MHHARRFRLFAILVFSTIITASAALADDAYFDVALDHLTLTEGALPKQHANDDWRNYSFLDVLNGYAVLDGPGEAYAVVGFTNPNAAAPNSHLVVRSPGAGDVTGRLFLENEAGTGMVQLRFKIPAADAKPEAKAAFYREMENYYEHLMSDNAPGAAWFRHRANEARKALGQREQDNNAQFANRASTLDDTYSLFSGNQALAENLQLDKALPPGAANPGVKEVDVNSLKGITVAPMDWTAYNKGKNPKADPLAKSIPIDQPAIFVANFPALIALADEADKYGTPVLQFTESQSQDAGTRQRYERQLGFSLTGLGKLLGPRLINSIAITASDPYLRAGGDIAVLFEPKDKAALSTLLEAQISLMRNAKAGAKVVDGKLDNVQYTGSVSDDRALSSYMGELKDGTIVVTNSLAELARLAAVDAGKSPALVAAPEYTFFRDRYKLGDADESALVVLSDATIRRWCSARYRIADSRRTRAAAVLANLDAKYLDKLVSGKIEVALIESEYPVPNLGELRLTPHGVTSSTYGSLEFLTPISELKLDTVTEGEAAAYGRWRDTYETNWRGVFDPIAIRLGVSDKKLSGDVTVKPLIWSSDYKPMVEIVSGAKLNPATADLHGALAHFGMAINMQAEQVKSVSQMAMGIAPTFKADPFGWVGQSIWLYADDDPFWGELSKAEKPEEFLEKNISRIPLALNVEVSNGFKLTGFLIALHAFVDQSSPGMTVWENLTYKDQPYVKVSPSLTAKGQNQDLKDAAVFYRATGESFLLTPNEALLKRAIDRQLDRDAAKKDGKAVATNGQPLLGESEMLQIDSKVYDFLERGARDDLERAMQRRSWLNLPILNEWKRRYPDKDPQKIYEQFFHAKLIDPAGGGYTWNEKFQTMESSTYGCPAAPKKGPAEISALTGLLRANFGLTYEKDGLRARAEVERKGQK